MNEDVSSPVLQYLSTGLGMKPGTYTSPLFVQHHYLVEQKNMIIAVNLLGC